MFGYLVRNSDGQKGDGNNDQSQQPVFHAEACFPKPIQKNQDRRNTEESYIDRNPIKPT